MRYTVETRQDGRWLSSFELKDEEFEAWLAMWKADKTLGNEFSVRRGR